MRNLFFLTTVITLGGSSAYGTLSINPENTPSETNSLEVNTPQRLSKNNSDAAKKPRAIGQNPQPHKINRLKKRTRAKRVCSCPGLRPALRNRYITTNPPLSPSDARFYKVLYTGVIGFYAIFYSKLIIDEYNNVGFSKHFYRCRKKFGLATSNIFGLSTAKEDYEDAKGNELCIDYAACLSETL